MTSQQPELDAAAVQQMIDSATRQMHEQIADLQKQLHVSYQQEQSLRRHQVFAASETITRLPSDAEDPISWGVVGAYRLADGHRSARTPPPLASPPETSNNTPYRRPPLPRHPLSTLNRKSHPSGACVT